MLPTDEDPVGGGGSPGTGGGGGGSIATGTVVFSGTLVKEKDSSLLKVSVFVSLSSGDDLVLTGFLTINGLIYSAGRIKATFDQQNSKSAMPMSIVGYVRGAGQGSSGLPGLPAGSYPLTFSIRNQDPSRAQLQVLTGSAIEITEFTAAAL